MDVRKFLTIGTIVDGCSGAGSGSGVLGVNTFSHTIEYGLFAALLAQSMSQKSSCPPAKPTYRPRGRLVPRPSGLSIVFPQFPHFPIGTPC